VFARGPAAAQVSDRAWLQAMLDVESALARVCAHRGAIPELAASAIAAVCESERFDLAALGREGVVTGNPVEPLVRALRAALPEEAAQYVHRGATSQDILDTAAMLVAKRTLDPIVSDADGAATVCVQLAERHRGTLMLGRTVLQQALPVTFGLKAAGWLVAIESARGNLVATAEWALAAQLGGAVGTLAAFGEGGPAVAGALARELDLAEPALPWHTDRVRPASLASALAVLAGALGKVARDVTLLAQNELAEVREGAADGRGRSSTMPHKRNPVAAVAVLACAGRAPGLAATMQAAMVQEHERAAGAWQTEWEAWSDLLRVAASAALAAREMLEGLEIDGARMRSNLGVAGDMVMAESVVSALADRLGWWGAQELVAAAAERAVEAGVALRKVLLETPELADALDARALDAALAPESYLGAASDFVDRALAAHRRVA
jgi:3-carboxy-cis,cis-muconate cycloisomerase